MNKNRACCNLLYPLLGYGDKEGSKEQHRDMGKMKTPWSTLTYFADATTAGG